MKLPAVGNHVWRQVNTLAVARNYYEEDMRFWLPRIDKRYQFDGVTGTQFPSYDYTLACIYKVTGYSETTHRWLSLIISFLAIWGMYKLAFSFRSNKIFASMSAMILLAIPEFYYHSINAVPDIMALTFMLWGWYFARSWLRTNSIKYWGFATLLICLAAMTKLLFLACAPVIAYEFFRNKYHLKFTWMWKAIVMVLIIGGASLGWYWYANYLTYIHWLNEFVHAARWPSSFIEFADILQLNVFTDIPETIVGYALLPGLLAGLFFAFRSRTIRPYAIFAVLGALVIYIPLQQQYRFHGYYFLAILPFFVLTIAYGFSRIVESKMRVIALFLVLSPGWAWARMHINWEKSHWRVPEAMLTPEFANQARKLSDTSVRWIVGLDQSGCIYFYYLHAKGFPWYNLEEKGDLFTKFEGDGAGGFITDDTATLKRYLPDSMFIEPHGNTGGFYWYKLRKVNMK